MKVLPCGDHAVLLDCANLDEARRWHAALTDVTEVVLGAQTVLVHGDPVHTREVLARTRPVERLDDAPSAEVEVPVVYDGPDLDDVARLIGLTTTEIIAAHTGTLWTAAFGGFTPGFSYLVGGDTRLQVPRRASPRTTVPAGSVALAGEFSGIYPRPSPGGWQLIGRTDLQMWDTARDPAALLAPGTVVRFREST